MAVKLKKRAMAEYSSQVLTEERHEQPIKRLKLSSRHSVSSDIEVDPILNIDLNSTERRILSELMKYSRHLKLSSSDNLETSIRRLEECLSRLKDNSVKYRLILIYAQILNTGKIGDIGEKMGKMCEHMTAESSNKLLSAWLQAAAICANKISHDKTVTGQVFEAGRQSLLRSANPQVHMSGLTLMAALVRPDTPDFNSKISSLIGSYSMSQDARVRSAAFSSLRRMHEERGVKLDVSLYPVLCSAIRDDYEGVRMEVLMIMRLLADVHPENQVKLDGDAGYNRLVDDVFSRICQSINDVREPVRCLAAQLIGNMSSVSQTFLEQTLDKKLMSNMRVKKSSHERQAGLVASGEWSSGKKWADDSPKEELGSKAVGLVSMGSCGAFVHGLEDECYSVRVAAVDSLTTLAMENHNLAVLALDFLVDMFNDEIEQVRLKAIESLTAISKHIKLQVHQLDIILSALDDFSTLLREKLHAMLQACSLATKDGLKSVINKLMVNLKKYPQDKRSILMTFKHLGANHPDLTLPLVTSLLHIHPFFDTPEPDIEDPAYLCNLVLVLNAAQHCPTLPPLLDQHTKRHHAYLKDTFPHLIPSASNNSQGANEGSLPSEAANFIQSILHRVSMSRRMSSASHINILQASCNELERIASVQESISDPATFARLYLEGQAVYEKIVRGYSWSHNKSSGAGGELAPATRTNIIRLHTIANKLNSMFSYVDAENKMLIRILKVKMLAVRLVCVVCNSNKSAKAESDEFLTEFEAVLMDIQDKDLCKYKFMEAFNALALTDSKPGQLANKLKPLLIKHPPVSLQAVPSSVKQAKAVIHEPVGGSETVLKCLAGLVLGIRMDAELFNIPDPSLLRVCIRAADQVNQLSVPKRGDLVSVADENFRLLTTALFSHQVWSESLDIEISIVLDLGSKDNLVPLSQTVKVSVLPKPVRRGI
eukprot:TRINITY_DN10050_c0_g1_i1.p1 TRINITY_DN10050_c0_g1~~TRINITY_DN10050_c0_g1_i1.p1  ORF type:complete len:939 (+),score=261.73 TRINITY_DN10050_c0_g1_i1:63-2879(+)